MQNESAAAYCIKSVDQLRHRIPDCVACPLEVSGDGRGLAVPVFKYPQKYHIHFYLVLKWNKWYYYGIK